MILHGDALEMLQQLEDRTVDCCVTSPPYYNLRDYGIDGQIGNELTPEEYIQKLVEVFHEVKRVLKDDGTLWLNVGDTYCTTAPGTRAPKLHLRELNEETKQARAFKRPQTPQGMKPKDLMGIPWMLAFALRSDGWYLRQDIIWHKSNVMPESVRDRCTKAHEYIFLLSKSRHYHFDHEAIKEPTVGFNNAEPAGSLGTFGSLQSRRRKGNAKSFRGSGAYTQNQSFDNSTSAERQTHGNTANATGKRNKRSVWTVSTKSYKGAHFATFPEALIRPCILAGCRSRGIVLDPFFGSGTTGKVAKNEGRDFIGIELNQDYIKLAAERIG